MSETEIALARAYLTASDQDPVAALIRSVKDLAQTRRMLASLPALIAALHDEEPVPRSPETIGDEEKRGEREPAPAPRGAWISPLDRGAVFPV